MDKLKMHSLDVIGSNIEKIQQLFPNCVTERLGKDGKPELAIDFEKLQAELSNEIIGEGEERYQFTWPDKRAANRLANTPTTMTLRPCREESVNFDHTQNLYIEGDNLDVLKALRETYLGKVKMIYIDPPYNTGNDFVYNDDFAQSRDEFEETSGLFDEEGNQTIDPMQRNTESNGRFHTDWLNMIYPRLKVARDLLSDDGVIFISIDDNEVENLRKICDEIFGKENLVANLIWEQGRKSMAAQVAVNHEYCLIYCKNRRYNIEYDNHFANENWKTRKEGLEKIYTEVDRLVKSYGSDIEKIEKGLTAFYKGLSDSDPAKSQSHYKKYDPCLGIYYQGDISQGTGKGGRFPIIHPVTGLPCKCPSGGWRFAESKLPELLRENRIAFGPDETTVPCLKRFLKETENEVFASVFYKDGRGASKRLDRLMDAHIFDYPKDEEVIKTFISLVTSYVDSDSLILDFFSGSATTAHAVMQLNAEDGGNRKFIMVQLPEKTDETSEAYKAGYKNICEIGKERIRRAGQKIKEENKDKEGIEKLDTGFRVLKLDSSNMEEVYYTPQEFTMQSLFSENVKADRTGEDLLFQVMLDLGIELSAKIETRQIAGKTVHLVDDNYMVACFDRDVTEAAIKEIAQLHPVYFVMRDASAANDNVIDNFEQIFRHYSPDTNCRII
ncbi:site-specific DNA-methyltransferase [Alistipes sp. An31A]|uniref:site-specific DNA-methyltransferase n=1 Tax=Alistipes sp. An31A TaxID=1965631 RepID=UPI000B39C90E|nr:site-specific DNA-methyltransferase [Alistipes sp. An31A]OUO20270.1 site-specific DNA-methyltransferase [Alistipes sp. An31A]